MWGKLFSVIALFSLCLYLYGVLQLITNSEPNNCKMTYMFEYPQFVKINFAENKNFPKYNLFAYSEGRLTENARNMHFTGAPVIFVPGNSGSYKQGRSFASVALRKGIENNWAQHLDYFTVDFNEEYTALFGGYLDDQTQFLVECIKVVLNLYKNLANKPNSVVIIGHSMGGKIAQSAITHDKVSNLVNTLILIASPVDRPVFNIDFYFEAFYRNVNTFWETNKNRKIITNVTNTCNTFDPHKKISDIDFEQLTSNAQTNGSLNNLLLVTIGGGSRDIIVNDGLTTSEFSDVHAMSTSIPGVWLTTDHLCSVWCLQQVIVVNRFLYSLIDTNKNQNIKNQGYHFVEDKTKRLQLAKHYFTQEKNPLNVGQQILIKESGNDNEFGDWYEDSRRVFSEQFKLGLKNPRFQMIRLINLPQNEILTVEAIGLETDDWVFGCTANEIRENLRFCRKGSSLSHYTKKNPSQRYGRVSLSLNLHELLKQNPSWTHIVLRILPTAKPLQLNIDIHSAGDRTIVVPLPKWYSFSSTNLLDDTILGGVSYTMTFIGLTESFKSLELSVKQRSCSKREHHATAKICVPWTEGYERFHHFTEQNEDAMNIYVPISKPMGYNATKNPVTVSLILDPNCRYTISIKNSFGQILSRIVQQFSHWLPSHLVAILLLSFKHQISLTPSGEPFKAGKLHSGLLKCSSFFIVTASKVFVKMVLWMKFLPNPDPYEHSLLISVTIHGSAMALLMLATGGLWISISFCGNIIHKILLKLINLPLPTISNTIVPLVQKCPMAASIVLIAIGTATCGGLGLILAVFVYFILITKMYEDYLEEFIYKTAELIARKLFGFKNQEEENASEIDADASNEQNENELSTEEINRIKENDAEFEEQDQEQTDEKKVETKNEEENKPEENDSVNKKSDDSDTKQLAEISDEERKTNEELDRLLKETWLSQQQQQLERSKELAKQRIEYDSVHEALSSINFHLSLFCLLVILAGLNLPSVLTWAKNYQYSPALKSDPSFSPFIITIVALSFLWQFRIPRNIQGYTTVGSMLYIMAAICTLYCQDSVYRLNAIISTVFVIVALHQMLTPTSNLSTSELNDLSGMDAEMKSRIERLKEELNNDFSTTPPAPTSAAS